MKTKIAGLASTALLLLAPISGAFSAVAESQVVQAENNWDYDTADPGLGEYDRLLQNAGPSDGQIDWYPAEHFASSKNIRPSLLVKQLIDLSIATNNANSNARKVLFNDTTGTSQKSDYQDTYKKYNLALGFIAQLLAFNNEKTGKGAYLKQGFESETGENPGGFHSEDTIAETQKTPDPAILGIPAIGEGVNISDVLGRAFFGNADDAYAQLYVNGYDNTVQNAPNIIRETTTSITIVAQSKLTGRKATAIFKLNNKTFNNLPDGVLLENKIDNSPSFAGSWGNQNIPDGEEKNLGDSTDGTFNQRGNLITGLTGDQRRLLSNGGSSAWVDPKTGSGTIVVPRGTSAAEIAKKIKQLGYKSNYNISNVAPMKAIHGDKYKGPRTDYKRTDDNSYNITYNENDIAHLTPTTDPMGNVTALSNDRFSGNDDENNFLAVADPRLNPKHEDPGYVSTNPNKYKDKDLTTNFSNALLYNPLNTNKADEFGFNDSTGYNNNTAKTIPNQKDSDVPNFGSGVLGKNNSQSTIISNLPTTVNSNSADDDLGSVVHAFEPKENAPVAAEKSPFMVREAWDDTHAIFGTAPFSGLTEEEIKNQIANNGSFNNTSGDQIKKSFTFNMPLNNSVMKSYRNPYSTVISTALPFSKTTDTKFQQGTHYSSGTGDMNNDFTTNKAGTYGVPSTNPWYVNLANSAKVSNDKYVPDTTGHKMNVTDSSAMPLHLDDDTWPSESLTDDTGKPGLYNVEGNKDFNHSLQPTPNSNSTFPAWVQSSTGSYDGTYRGRDTNGLKGNVRLLQSPVNEWVWQTDHTVTNVRRSENRASSINDQFSYEDAGLHDPTWAGFLTEGTRLQDTVNLGSSSYTIYKRTFSGKDTQETTKNSKQLAKNVGYILVNATGLSEKDQQELSNYEIPSLGNDLMNRANSALSLPKTQPVYDDKAYRGGLLGVMSIHGSENVGGSAETALKQNGAGSIYNTLLTSTNKYLKVPQDSSASTTPQIVMADFNNLNQSKYAANTDLHYGLAWNDSSDLPQVKIERSLNVQYLIPVSISREVTTTWHQDQAANESWERTEGRTWWRIKRSITTSYHDYKLYLGETKLDGTGNSATLNETGNLSKLLPVNNQIEYKRTDNSYPHYDSELFDHGSNRDDVTVTHGGLRTPDQVFVGNTEEKDSEKDTNSKYVGSSDDYSIGIVKAPSFLKRNGATGELEYKGNTDFTRDTENEANEKDGMNPMADTPENNNGMAIRDPKSYATLAQAYNVEINGNKAVGKADDNSKNKGDRVALVQQLLDNGGDPEAYYYIPSLPRLYEKWNDARINVVVYDKAAVPAPSKAETKPSFSTTDVSTGNDPFNVNLRPYTTVYDDGAVLKASDVPQNFKNLLTRELVAGNPDLVTSDGKVATDKLQQILVGAFLNSWQQNDGSFNQTDTGAGVNSPLYLYGGFGISNSDSKNSYSQWPDGYTTPNLSSSKYHEAVTNYPGDFYRGGKDLKTTGATVIKGIPATALKADVSKVDLSKAGTYPVVYTYTNPSNDKDSASITVPVTVTDSAAPVFAFQGGSDLTIKVGESFDRSAFKVVGSWQIFNKYQGDYTKLVNYEGIAKNSKGEPDVTISGDVDTQTPGIYQLTYKATSIGGAVTTMNRNITVLPKETTGSDWKVSDFASVGYINYVPNYGINVWNAPAGTFTGQRLTHGTSWKIFQKAVNSQGKVYYQVGKNQWIDSAYVSFTPVSAFQPLNGIVTINYVRGYGVNLWKAPKTTGGYYEGRKLQHGTKWKVFGIQDGFYKVGGNQWIQAKYAKFQTR